MAADPPAPSELPVDPNDLAGATDEALAEAAAAAWAAEGYRTTTKEHGSHVFVFAKRRDDGQTRGEIVWVAGGRAVDPPHLEQLRALAEKTGADSAACLVVGSGGVAESDAAAHDVTTLDGDDLRAKLGVDGRTDADPSADGDDPTTGLGTTSDGPEDLPPAGDADRSPPDESGGGTDDGERTLPDVDSSVEASRRAEFGPNEHGDDSSTSSGIAGTAQPSEGDNSNEGAASSERSGDPTAPESTESSTARGQRLDVWGGRTSGVDLGQAPFDGLWAAVTRGDAVETVADLAVWDDTTR